MYHFSSVNSKLLLTEIHHLKTAVDDIMSAKSNVFNYSPILHLDNRFRKMRIKWHKYMVDTGQRDRWLPRSNRLSVWPNNAIAWLLHNKERMVTAKVILHGQGMSAVNLHYWWSATSTGTEHHLRRVCVYNRIQLLLFQTRIICDGIAQWPFCELLCITSYCKVLRLATTMHFYPLCKSYAVQLHWQNWLIKPIVNSCDADFLSVTMHHQFEN